MYEDGKNYVTQERLSHEEELPFKLMTPDLRLKNSKIIRNKFNDHYVSPLIDRRHNENSLFRTPDDVSCMSNDKKYTIVRSTNNPYVSSPEYVNIPLKVPSSSKNSRSNKDYTNNAFQHNKSTSDFRHKSSMKNSYIRKASPEVDEIGDSSEGDSSSYLSAISYQSRIEMNSETMFSHRYDDVDNYPLPNARKYSKSSTHNFNQL